MAETPEKSGSTQTEKDRRVKARQRIHSLSYVEIGESNGGIVLNISEGGISGQAATVLEQGETVAMRIQIPRARKKLEVNGEIVWLSASRKEAGLRFVDLPERSLQQIRQWMAREASPEKFEDESDPVDEDQVETVEVNQQEKSEIDQRIEANGDIDITVKEEAESEADVIEEFAAEDSEEIEEAEEVEEIEAQQEAEEIEELEERASLIASNEAEEEGEQEAETVTEAAAVREEEVKDEPET